MDINDGSVRIVKLKKKRKGFTLVSFNEVPLEPGIVKEGVIVNSDALAAIIATACKSVKGKKLATPYVAVSLPEEKSFLQIVKMPKMSYAELAVALPLETENYIPLPIDKVYMDFQEILPHGAGPGSNSEILINAMPRSVVDTYVACCKKAGLVPAIMEVESQAIVRALFKPEQLRMPMAVLDIGFHATSLIIVDANAVRFTCTLLVSSLSMTDAIAKRLDITPAKAEALKVKYGLSKKTDKEKNIKDIITPLVDELAAQVKKYLNFYYSHVSSTHESSHEKVETITLCGGGANLKDLSEYLAKSLGLNVEVGNPLINILPKGVAKAMPAPLSLSFSTAMGLAIRAAGEKSIGATDI